MLIILIPTTVAFGLLYTNIAALLPIFAAENHSSISSAAIGLLFSSYQISFLALAPFIGSNIDKWGRRCSMLISITIITVATVAFAAAGLIEDDWTFYIVSIAARTMQGVGEAFFMITAPSILAIQYPDKIELYNGYWNAALGVGNTIGPALSALLYSWLSYTETLSVFAALICIIGYSLMILIPKSFENNI